MSMKLLLGVSGAALIWPLHVQAQDAAPVPQSTPEANSPDGAAVAPASPDGQGGLSEIIVTAQ
jgi:hypothetical protein